MESLHWLCPCPFQADLFLLTSQTQQSMGAGKAGESYWLRLWPQGREVAKQCQRAKAVSTGSGRLGPGWGSLETPECRLGWPVTQECLSTLLPRDLVGIGSIDGWVDRAGRQTEEIYARV